MTKPISYAGRLDRLFAHVIDRLIVTFAIILTLSLTAPMETLETMILNNHPSVLIVTFFCYVGYYTVFTASGWQATPGKRLMRIRVIRADGSALGQREAAERALAFLLPTLPLYTSMLDAELASILFMGLTLFWFGPILSDPLRMGVHDKLCRTRVITGRA